MEKINILWADDEIDLLKPHILFLNSKGYEIITALSGDEAIDIVKENKNLSAVLLDENDPKGPCFYAHEQCTDEEENNGYLQTIYENGKFYNQTTMTIIRAKIDKLTSL